MRSEIKEFHNDQHQGIKLVTGSSNLTKQVVTWTCACGELSSVRVDKCSGFLALWTWNQKWERGLSIHQNRIPAKFNVTWTALTASNHWYEKTSAVWGSGSTRACTWLYKWRFALYRKMWASLFLSTFLVVVIWTFKTGCWTFGGLDLWCDLKKNGKDDWLSYDNLRLAKN